MTAFQPKAAITEALCLQAFANGKPSKGRGKDDFVAQVACRARLRPVKRHVKAIHSRCVAGHKTFAAMKAEIRLRRILDLTGRTIHCLRASSPDRGLQGEILAGGDGFAGEKSCL